MGAVRGALAGLLAGGLVLAGLGGQVAVAFTVDPAVQAGVQLPPHALPAPGYVEFQSATPGYVVYDVHQQDEYSFLPLLVRRTSDGSVARTLTVKANTPQPYLSESSVVVREPVPGAVGATRFTVSSIETGIEQWSVDVPADETIVGAGASWVLTAVGSTGQAFLRRPGAAASAVAGVTLSGSNSSGPGALADARTLLVHDMSKIWSIDLASGLPTLLTASAGWYDQLILTPSRVFWVDDARVGTALASWSARDGSNQGSVLVAGADLTRGYVGFGDRLAAYHYEQPAVTYRAGLCPVDLATGQLEPPVATQVATARDLGDGNVALVLGDTPTGRVGTITDDGQPVKQLAEFPVIGQNTTALALSGDRVVAGFGDPYTAASGPVLFTQAGGSGGWSGALAVGDESMPGGLVAAKGDVVLTDFADHYLSMDMRVSWPGGHRDLLAVPGAALARGGKVLVRATDNSGAGVLEDVKTGRQLSTVTTGELFTVDGMELWRGPDAQGNLVGTDLNGSAPVRTVATGRSGCLGAPAQVSGRFALILCNGTFVALDTLGILPPWDIPWSSADLALQPTLGNGFVTWGRYLKDPSGTVYAVAQVVDLGPAHGSRLYGPLHGAYSPPRIMVTADDQGGHRIAYVDTTSQVRLADLDWLSEPPPPQAPPAPTGVSATGGDTEAVVSWIAPSTNGGSAITGYTVTATPGGMTVATTGPTTTTITGLTNGTAYTFAVTATNAVGTSAGSPQSNPVIPATHTRLAGADRYATAVAISQYGFKPQSLAAQFPVTVASGSNFPDALAAGPVAAAQGGPLLLVPQDGALPSTVTAELRRLNPSRVDIAGGTAAVSGAVQSELQAFARLGAVFRWAGQNRYETAAKLAGLTGGLGKTVFIATGASFPDALGGSAAAGRLGGALMLTDRYALPQATATALTSGKPTKVVVLGGVAVIDPAVLLEIKALLLPGTTMERWAGADRYATAAAISLNTYPQGATTAYLASGASYPDALAGAPVAARAGAPLLLTSRDCIPASTFAELTRLGVTNIVVLGGTAAVSDAAANLTGCNG